MRKCSRNKTRSIFSSFNCPGLSCSSLPICKDRSIESFENRVHKRSERLFINFLLSGSRVIHRIKTKGSHSLTRIIRSSSYIDSALGRINIDYSFMSI
uniref:Uncharacterized protein n=1 Tax=Lepeophtheirus salmonis TaxID=72036 RepID=A0A0K2TUU1_LEPSM